MEWKKFNLKKEMSMRPFVEGEILDESQVHIEPQHKQEGHPKIGDWVVKNFDLSFEDSEDTFYLITKELFDKYFVDIN